MQSLWGGAGQAKCGLMVAVDDVELPALDAPRDDRDRRPAVFLWFQCHLLLHEYEQTRNRRGNNTIVCWFQVQVSAQVKIKHSCVQLQELHCLPLYFC